MNKKKYEAQYKVVKVGSNCWPQVRIKTGWFWSRWKKIAEHASGYGLYDLPDWDYPKTFAEAVDIIYKFHGWSGYFTSQPLVP